ncbi:MAG: hypothetical protein CM1200mP4_0830 [Rhodospirillaceae bacterium]|nr:MAG: hypothetical protein CM1200mP4_0830 [Rhodospirillaceae bacterium]
MRQGTSGETFLRMADESDGRALFTVGFFNQNDEALRRVLSSFCDAWSRGSRGTCQSNHGLRLVYFFS